jgi:hypothetical protein
MKKLFAAWTLAAVLFAPSLAVINSDTFTGTNGDDLESGHSPDVGGGWTDGGVCDFKIQSNRATQTSATSICMTTVESSDASVAVVVDLVVPAANDYSFGLTVRHSDNGNAWWVNVSRASGGTPIMELTEWNTSANTLRDSDTLGAISGTTIEFAATATGNTITGYVNGTSYSTYASATYNNTATRHGLFMYSDGTYTNNVSWDDFSVDADHTSYPPAGGATINPATINSPIRGGGLLGLVKGALRVR